MGLHIVSTGRCLPEKVVTNDDLSRIVETNDEWITKRTGIKERRIVENESNLDLAYAAGEAALEKAGIDRSLISALIVTTFTSDYYTPSLACPLAKKLGLANDIPAFDINAACSGFLYALHIASGLLTQDERPYVLIVGSEIISRTVDWNDRGTCILFGDGAGATLVERSEDKTYAVSLGSDGDDEIIHCGGAASDDRFIKMDGREVFKFAVSTIPKVVDDLLDKTGMTLDDIDYVVCHQANKRIIDSVIKKYGAPEEKFFLNLQHYGNTSSASIPIALDEMFERGLLKKGNKIICVGFGAGLTWGGAVLEI